MLAGSPLAEASRPALVLFDCDGVLVDTEVVSSDTLAAMLTQHGVPTSSAALRVRIKGCSLDWIAEESARVLGGTLPAGWIDEFIARRLVIFQEGVPQIPGAAQAVRAVRSAGIALGVASQGSRAKMAVTLPASGMDAVLGDAPIFSGDDVVRGKPHPDLYLHAAASFGVPAALTVVIEDSVPGVTAAAAAGMRVLGYAGDESPARLVAAGAEVVHDLRDVAALLGIAPAP
jgi:beta-phosphoglucomutase-like phosphatase (HAD superfamily)